MAHVGPPQVFVRCIHRIIKLPSRGTRRWMSSRTELLESRKKRWFFGSCFFRVTRSVKSNLWKFPWPFFSFSFLRSSFESAVCSEDNFQEAKQDGLWEWHGSTVLSEIELKWPDCQRSKSSLHSYGAALVDWNFRTLRLIDGCWQCQFQEKCWTHSVNAATWVCHSRTSSQQRPLQRHHLLCRHSRGKWSWAISYCSD